MPAYTMGKSKRQGAFYKPTNTPGVGSYDQQKSWAKSSRIKSQPSNSVGKAAKLHTFKINENVGPGSYNVDKPENKDAPSFKGKPKIRFQTEAPSPADYNPDKKFGSKQYTIGRERRKLKVPDGPGPAAYDIKNLNQTCVNTFSKEQRDANHPKLMPGPGQYEGQSQRKLKKQPQYSFNKMKKFREDQIVQNQKKQVPGPGTYSINHIKKFFRGGKFTQAPRSKVQQTSRPGPGAYNMSSSNLKQSPKCTIGYSSRLNSERNVKNPGPGAYNSTQIQKTKKNYGSTIFTTENRNWIKDTCSPGPGTYELDKKQYSSVNGPSFTAKNLHETKETTPGPQDYNPNHKKVEKGNGNTIIGSQEKLKRLRTENPGPGQYYSVQQLGAKSFYFNKTARKQKMHQTIGPGQYKLKPYFGMYDGIEKEKKKFLYV